MQLAARSSICAAAQALKGSARGIGAWRVVSAVEAVELAAASGAEPELRSAVDRLGVVAEETRAAIAELLHGNYGGREPRADSCGLDGHNGSPSDRNVAPAQINGNGPAFPRL